MQLCFYILQQTITKKFYHYAGGVKTNQDPDTNDKYPYYYVLYEDSQKQLVALLNKKDIMKIRKEFTYIPEE
jgi:hypothetical protein